MNAVIISFPGHFLLTRLTIESLRYFYKNIRQIYIVYDITLTEGWPDYVNDAADFYSINKQNFITFKEIDQNIPLCQMGWYRQQLVKCCIDKFFKEDRWFVVDGDIIFDEHINLENITPVHFRNDSDSPLNRSVLTCVSRFLNIEFHPLLSDGQYKITSSIPFRILERTTLENLRRITENYLKGDFVEKITELCHNQELVAYDETGERMVMNEWELIEAVNHLLYPGRFQIENTGSGYDHFKHTSLMKPGHRFRQGFVYDYQIYRSWFDAQFADPVTDIIWNKVEAFSKYIQHKESQPL
jgi:hypothetical protein